MYKLFIKRVLDFLFSSFFIIITFPLMIIIGIITYTQLKRPIFYEFKKREGKNKVPFQMYKFRTKTIGTRGMPIHIRYTKISMIIDITRLNELPQLFNILKGDMSFVGPRPLIVDDVVSDHIKISPKRYLVRPGLTGLAQSMGGQTISIEDKFKYDEIYYDNISFIYDLKIFIRTFKWLITYLIKYIKNPLI